MVTRYAVIYLHPLTYGTTPTATRHRHLFYANVPERRASSGPTFVHAELSKHQQMNRDFPLNSEPRPLFNPPLVACREDQSEYIPYRFCPFTLGPFQPKKTLTRLTDVNYPFLAEKLHEIFPTAFQAPVGSFAHLLALTYTHILNALNPVDPAFRQEKVRLQVLLITNPTTLN